MTAFQQKQLRSARTLGERLRAVREEAGLSLTRAAQESDIQQSYLSAIEASAYSQLPSEVYARNFVKRYAEYLELNRVSVLQIYDRERRLMEKAGQLNAPSPPPIASSKGLHFIITPRRIRQLGFILIVLACFAYLGYTIYSSYSPPRLVIAQPASDLVIDTRTVEVAGRVDQDASLTINGQEVFLGRDGAFREIINLQEGINIIEIKATQKRGQSTTIYRRVLVNHT